MRTQRRLFSMLGLVPLLAVLPATRFVIAGAGSNSGKVPVACKLLTAAEATTALEQPSLPGKALVDSTGCVWSEDPAALDSSRRVVLMTRSLMSFRAAMHPAIKTINIEPVAGLGDEAFYQIYPNDQSPFIWVRKGETAFVIRILIGAKVRPFTLEQEKAKELVLAKAAVSRV